LFKWRFERESEVGDKGDIPWLVPSDYVSIFGMLSFVLGVVLLPISGLVGSRVAHWAFGLGTLLFIGQALGLAGHDQATINCLTEPINANSSGFLCRKR